MDLVIYIGENVDVLYVWDLRLVFVFFIRFVLIGFGDIKINLIFDLFIDNFLCNFLVIVFIVCLVVLYIILYGGIL